MKAEIFIGIAVLGLTACSHVQPPKPTRYILDSGVTGFVKVNYNRSDAPALPDENGFAVVRISKDMTISTRSPMNPSWDGSEFYYQTPDGKRVRLSSKDDAQRLLWAMEKTPPNDQTSENQVAQESFFVGSQEQLTRVFKGVTGNGLLEVKPTPEGKIEAVSQPDRMRIETDLTK